MEFIKLTHDNLESEHICCAISNNNDCQVKSKKSWIADRLDEGLVFLKADVRGKCFIEYIPAKNAWVPICADDYMYIDCLWVSGQFKGKGYSNTLMEKCIQDSKEKGYKGLVILSSPKKMGFLADKKYLIHKGFEVCDTKEHYFELMYMPFEKGIAKPYFRNIDNRNSNGFIISYTSQCPFNAKYVPLLEKVAEGYKAPLTINYIDTVLKAQNNVCPFTTFSLYYNGEFITHEIQSEKKFAKILEGKGFTK